MHGHQSVTMSVAPASNRLASARVIGRTRLHTLISTDLSEWAAHRRAVVLAVSRQVPGANPEFATSQGLARLCREIVVRGAVDHPVDFWHRAAVDAAVASVAPTVELDAAPAPVTVPAPESVTAPAAKPGPTPAVTPADGPPTGGPPVTTPADGASLAAPTEPAALAVPPVGTPPIAPGDATPGDAASDDATPGSAVPGDGAPHHPTDRPSGREATSDTGGPPTLPPSIQPTRRAIDFEHLNTAMERLPDRDRRLLWERHVHDRPVEQIAEDVGVLPYAARRRLRRAENVLAAGFAEAHASASDRDECRTTRGAMHDYIRHRLLPGRRQDLEDHLVECPECTRAFADVRESYWMLRAAAPVLLLGTVSVPGAAGSAGTTGAAAGGTAAGTALGAALGDAGTAGSGMTAMSALLGKSFAVLGKSVVVARTLAFDPATLVVAIAGTLLATGAATGVAVRSGGEGFATSSQVLRPVAESAASSEPRPARPTTADTRSADESPAASAAGVPPLTLPSTLPSPSDTADLVPADMSDGGDDLEVGVGLGDAVGVEAGIGAEVGEGHAEVTVQVAADGEILYSLYEIVLTPDTEILEISLSRDFGLVTKLNDTYYVIPAVATLTAADVRAQVTLAGPDGATARIAAVTEDSARRQGFTGLHELVAALGTRLDATTATDVPSRALSEVLLTADGTLRSTRGTLDDLGGALGTTLDALLGR